MPKRSCPRMKNTTNNKWWMTYLLLTAGTFFMAVGINVIYEPLSMVTGGFSGIGILVKKLTQTARWSGIPVGMTTLLLNIPLFIWGYSQKGKVFVKKTVYAASCFSFFLLIIPTFDIVKQDYLMAALVGGLLNGTGIGLVFSQGASTGGSDLLSVLTAKILPGLSASERLILIDTLIVAAGCIYLWTGDRFICRRCGVCYGKGVECDSRWTEVCQNCLYHKRPPRRNLRAYSSGTWERAYRLGRAGNVFRKTQNGSYVRCV